MLIVLGAGGAIGIVGTLALFFIFRAFGGKTPGSSSHFGLMAALVGFVFAVCFALFIVSYR
ncbi:MAG TPA: hypothetical protein VF846_15675 [Thermoanaerobaculia bacterium]|jgi:uncharacterized membrane protein YeaQ/YmgE (transglycosylase-associated protein family)